MITALTSLLTTILVAGGSGVPPQQQTPYIHVVYNSHEVDFPNSVVFKMTAESDSLITEVGFFYQLARQKIKVYGYPEFTPATKISTEFRLKTGGRNYIPTGAEIQYFYRITNASGYTIETEKYSLEYKNPDFNWQTLSQGNLVILWHDIPKHRVQEVTTNANNRIDEIKTLFGLNTVLTMKAVLLTNTREARQVFPQISDTATREHVYGGFAFQNYDLFVLSGLKLDGMVHEISHLLLHQSMQSRTSRMPAWLNEGLAMYFESSSHGRTKILNQAALDGKLLKLRSMNAVPGKPEDIRIFYAQSWSIVQYLIDTYGPANITSVIRAISSGTHIDPALQQAYGFSLEQIETRWKTDVIGATPLSPRPNIGTIVSTTLIASSVALAIIATFFRWIFRRMKSSNSNTDL